MNQNKTTRTITFQPANDVRSLLKKAARRRKGVPKSALINEALRTALVHLAGKREAA